MPVQQELINLLNLPVAMLKRLCIQADVGVRNDANKWELANALGQLPRPQLEELAGKWLYAGQTSVTWLFLGDRDEASSAEPGAAADGAEEPLQRERLGARLTVEAVREALVAQHGSDPFTDDVRPAESGPGLSSLRRVRSTTTRSFSRW